MNKIGDLQLIQETCRNDLLLQYIFKTDNFTFTPYTSRKRSWRGGVSYHFRVGSTHKVRVTVMDEQRWDNARRTYVSTGAREIYVCLQIPYIWLKEYARVESHDNSQSQFLSLKDRILRHCEKADQMFAIAP